MGITYSSMRQVLIDEVKNIHCENLIGAVSIPLGVAGPFKISGQYAKKNYNIPLATTEGALIASIQRGSKATFLSKGIRTIVESVGITRGPVFQTNSIVESMQLKQWLDNNIDLLKKVAKQTSSHLVLKKLGTRVAGLFVYVRFYFDTQDAMGMNMATIATQKVVETIEEKTKIPCLSLAGNFDIDKKPGWLNFISGRGKRVWAEAIIPKKIIKEVLKTSAQQIYNVWLGKCMIGSAMAGSLGFNCHFANIVAAFFAATGQDLAHVVEGSMGITTTNIVNKEDLYISIFMPSVLVGIVGGGTKLRTQTEALSIIGAKTSLELAEVLGAAVLAGELSLLASLAEGSLAQAHQRLGK
jgi:hydroxymethylglutaryl-CoA reductase (NADPH)